MQFGIETKSKKIIAASAALLLAMGMSACVSEESDSDQSGAFTKINSVFVASGVMGVTDQNPDNMPSAPPAGNPKPDFSRLGNAIAVVSTKSGVAAVYNCPASGTIEIEILGDGDLSGTQESGDGANFTYHNCIFAADAETIDGSVHFLFIAVAGIPFDNTADWSLATEYSYDVTQTLPAVPAETQTGGFVVTVSYEQATDQLTTRFTDVSYTTANGSTVTWSQDFSYEITINGNGGTEYSINGSADIAGNNYTGTVTVATSETFIRAIDGRFLAGELTITNNVDSSSIRVSADNNGDLLVEADTDGDGNFDFSATVRNYDI